MNIPSPSDLAALALGVADTLQARLTSGVRTCKSCRHGTSLSREEFKDRLSRHSSSLEQSLRLTDHPVLKGALDSGKAFSWCELHRMFLETADTCDQHSFLGVRERLGIVPLGVPPTRPKGVSQPPMRPKSQPESQPTSRPESASIPTQTDFDRGVCFACGLRHDACRSCGVWRGICGRCECGHGILYSRARNDWRCSACDRHGAGQHPTMPMKWPAHGLCDGCYERTEKEKKAREAKAADEILREVVGEIEDPPRAGDVPVRGGLDALFQDVFNGPTDRKQRIKSGAPMDHARPMEPHTEPRTASAAPLSDAVRSGGLTMIPKASSTGPWEPGHWRAWENKPGVKAAALTCIGCKRALFLNPSIHTILLDGMVTPSFVCTHPGCTWHVWIRLVDWVPAQAEKEPPVLEAPTTSTFGGSSF